MGQKEEGLDSGIIMSDDNQISKKKIYIFFIVGGAIVATAYLFGWILGDTWMGWWVANVLHFIGGFYAFFFVRATFLYTKLLHQTSTKFWMEIILFIAGALILGVFWEWYELAVDRYQLFVMGEPSIMTYADNIGDLIIDTLGAAVAARVHFRNKWSG